MCNLALLIVLPEFISKIPSKALITLILDVKLTVFFEEDKFFINKIPESIKINKKNKTNGIDFFLVSSWSSLFFKDCSKFIVE